MYNRCRDVYEIGGDYYMRVVGHASNLLGVRNIYLFKANSNNACAYIDEEGDWVISYDPRFFSAIGDSSPLYPILVLFHEVGHHYDWFRCRINHRKQDELDADKIAGWLAYQFGYNLHECLPMYDLVEFSNGGPHHPPGVVRKTAFIQGWRWAQKGFQPVCRRA